MNNFEERIAELVAVRSVEALDDVEIGTDNGIDMAIPLINDLHAALQAERQGKAKFRNLEELLGTGADSDSAVMRLWDNVRGLLLESPESDLARQAFEAGIEEIAGQITVSLQAEKQGNAVLRKVGKELRDTLSEIGGVVTALRENELPKLEEALQAKDAEIAELTMQRGADEQGLLMWQRKVEQRGVEIAELKHDVAEQLKIIAAQGKEVEDLRGLLGEAVKYVNAKCGCKTMQMMCFAPCEERLLSDKLITALAKAEAIAGGVKDEKTK